MRINTLGSIDPKSISGNNFFKENSIVCKLILTRFDILKPFKTKTCVNTSLI